MVVCCWSCLTERTALSLASQVKCSCPCVQKHRTKGVQDKLFQAWRTCWCKQAGRKESLPTFAISVDIAGLHDSKAPVQWNALTPVWQGMIGEMDTCSLHYNVVLAVPWGIGKWPQWQYHCLLQVRREWSPCVYIVSGHNRANMYLQCFNCLTEKVNKLSESWPHFKSSEVWFRKSCSHWSKVYKSSPDFLRL